MKRKIVLIMCVLIAKTAFGQWESIDVLSQRDANWIFKTNQSLFLLSENAKCLYKSDDNGLSWQENLFLPTFSIFVNPTVRNIFVSEDTILICAYHNVYRTFNNGNNWSQTPIQSMPQSYYYLNNTLYRTDNMVFGSVFKSNNFGVNWVQDSLSSISELYVTSTKELNDTLYALSSLDTTVIYRIIGENDVELICGVPDYYNCFNVNEHFMGYISYGNEAGSILNLSTNKGLTWTTHDFQKQVNSLFFNGDTIVVVFNESVQYSIDEGLTWISISGLQNFRSFWEYFFIDGREYLNTDNDFLCRQSNQLEWQYADIHYAAKYPFGLKVKDNYLFFATTGNYLRKTIGQEDLKSLTIFEDSNEVVYGLEKFGNTLFQFTPNVGLARSEDNGDTWVQIDLGIPNFTYNEYSVVKMTESNDTLYLIINQYYQSYYILTSVNDGVSWSIIYSEDFQNSWITALNNIVLFKIGNFIFVGCSGSAGSFYRRYNIENGIISGFSNLQPPTLFTTSIENTIISYDYKSNDFGNTWIPCGNGLPQGHYPYHYNFFGNDSIMFCFVDPDYDIFASFSQGDNWFSIKDNLQSEYIMSAYLNNDSLYVATLFDSLYVRSIYDIEQNFVSGIVFFDNNNNQDFDESYDTRASGIKVYSAMSSNNYTTSSSGNYYIYLSGAINNDTLRVLNIPLYSSMTPEYYVVNHSDTSKNFAISRIQGINDLRIDITSYSVPRPGFGYTLNITCKNEGTTSLDANVSLNIDDLFTFQNSSEAPSNILGNVVNWSIPNFQPLQSKSFTVNLQLTNLNVIGEQISLIATISPILSDTTMENNTDSISDIVVGSFDPNEKTINRAIYLSPQQVLNKSEMIYTVRFQNTGTWYAENVSILDTLHRNLDLSTFRVISASHDYNFDFSGNGIVRFNFPNINLPDSNMNEAASHGFIKYAIRLNNNIPLNDSITNTAHIYFDFNEAIVTNTALNIVKIDAAINETNQDFNLNVYPNPAKTLLNIRFEKFSSYNLTLFSIDGRIVMNEKSNSEHHVLNIASLDKGIYLLKVSDNNRSKIVKVVIQ